MTDKTPHVSPREYRILYRMCDAQNHPLGGSEDPWTNPLRQSEALQTQNSQIEKQYYSVFHSSQALEYLAHTFRKGNIHGANCLHVISVEELNRYSGRWEERTLKAVKHASSAEIIINHENIFITDAQSASTR